VNVEFKLNGFESSKVSKYFNKIQAIEIQIAWAKRQY